MNTSFANGITTALSKCFFYCPGNSFPSIQVGKLYEGDLIFWLRYNDEAINKCASTLIRKFGGKLGVSDIQCAKKLLLDFSSYAFNTIDADFHALHLTGDSVNDIISRQHRNILSLMFKEYISSKMKFHPYIYNLGCARFEGVLKLSDDLYIYGFGEVDGLLVDIKNETEIEIPRAFLDEEGMRDEPFGRYARKLCTSVAVAYACSKDEAIEIFNRLFGALCLTIDRPFMISQSIVDNRIESFDNGKYNISEFRTNLPAVHDLNISDSVVDNLKKIFSSLDKRMLSALSFIAHGWRHDKRERFLNQFIALDAMYGNNNENKNSIIGGVCRDAVAIEGVSSKIEMIYDLRCKFVHGDIPTFYGHGKYLKFVDEHGIDPIVSLFEILKECALNYNGRYKIVRSEDNTTRTMCIPVELLPEIMGIVEQYNKST